MYRPLFKLFIIGILLLSIETLTAQVPYVTYDELEHIIAERSDSKTLVVNFWATWCVPCVKELPVFESVQSEGNQDFLYVSLDFERKIETKLIPFIEENTFLTDKVVVIDQSNSNTWIPMVDNQWSGAIPVTLVIADGAKKFHEGGFETTDELKEFINK